ncbi:MAG: sugar transferase [Erysipelotrichaceae bacterium]|nr:sugar transferase [Erysipelotrichaceae bacterium]
MKLYRQKSFYEKYIKRLLDIICSLLAIVVFSWLFIIIAIVVRIKMGSPVLFKQPRPGMIDPKTGREKIFNMYKFRSMTDKRDENGELLPDEERLSTFGKMLRATSLDELPEAFNIIKGDMSVIGPRPQLVRDMVFMSDEQRMRHTAKPGLSGLAQVMGRNAITWEDKLNWDLRYINNVSFVEDCKIVLMTAKKVFFRKNITESNKEIDVTIDYGDELLKNKQVSREEYETMQIKAINLIKEFEEKA